MAEYVIPAVVTTAVSDKQRAYAEDVAAGRASLLAHAFQVYRNVLEDEAERRFVDAAVARFTGAPAAFWIDINHRFEDVAVILACREAGIDDHGVTDSLAIRCAGLV